MVTRATNVPAKRSKEVVVGLGRRETTLEYTGTMERKPSHHHSGNPSQAEPLSESLFQLTAFARIELECVGKGVAVIPDLGD